MPLRPKDFDQLKAYLGEGITVLGMRFLGLSGPQIAPGTKYTASGWSDAWFDYSVPGLFKLNCFFQVSNPLYKIARDANWAPVNFKRVQRPATATSKAVDGDVLQNGISSPMSRNIQSNMGTDLKNEEFQVALFESFLVKPPEINLEMKLVSKELVNGKPKESLVLNAHLF